MHTLLTTRLSNKTDQNFILATWLKGLRYGCEYFEALEATEYFDQYNRILKEVLARPSTITEIACLVDEPDTIIGYAVKTPPNTLHWIFVKSAWRGQGVAHKLLGEGIIAATHYSAPGLAIMRKKQIIFRPWLLGVPK